MHVRHFLALPCEIICIEIYMIMLILGFSDGFIKISVEIELSLRVASLNGQCTALLEELSPG